jgi:hypothetical protein
MWNINNENILNYIKSYLKKDNERYNDIISHHDLRALPEILRGFIKKLNKLLFYVISLIFTAARSTPT